MDVLVEREFMFICGVLRGKFINSKMKHQFVRDNIILWRIFTLERIPLDWFGKRENCMFVSEELSDDALSGGAEVGAHFAGHLILRGK